MSDFDEEAERQRLREKYEKDEERRKETQQMSELLLKGATMTNRHCDECGSPIFRYQGQAFCPSCQRVTGGEGAASESEAAESSPEMTPSSEADAASRSESNGAVERDSTPAVGSVETDAPESGRSVAPDPESDSEPEPNAAAAAEVGVSPKPAATSGRSADSGGTPRGPSTAVGRAPGAADEGSAAASERTARDALLRALTRHAQLAERTDDPRQAKAHLAAAREAAEALDELE
ncbi:Sjogren's syndrome/scleroderma autoantigen 1 family protein [Halobellus rarus]|uniref:Sjogren's syndrome/scleroderma autoantigen 1 family protein n=1 Tax=Halobellus rarus TaxID=1126237 RepID=A0ABD6CMS3_9EURY